VNFLKQIITVLPLAFITVITIAIMLFFRQSGYAEANSISTAEMLSPISVPALITGYIALRINQT